MPRPTDVSLLTFTKISRYKLSIKHQSTHHFCHKHRLRTSERFPLLLPLLLAAKSLKDSDFKIAGGKRRFYSYRH
ncbi:hypothetical protein L1887_06023 [Cichorium endivia]|nr:hypothetical protein L1887_06023 [Cichorium endivia]